MFVYEVETIDELGQMETQELQPGDWARVALFAQHDRWTGEFVFARDQPKAYSWYFRAVDGGFWIAQEHAKKQPPSPAPSGPRGATVPRMDAFGRIWEKFGRFFNDVFPDMEDAVKEITDQLPEPLPPGVVRTEETTVEEHKHNGLTIRVTKTVKRRSVTSVTEGIAKQPCQECARVMAATPVGTAFSCFGCGARYDVDHDLIWRPEEKPEPRGRCAAMPCVCRMEGKDPKGCVYNQLLW